MKLTSQLDVEPLYEIPSQDPYIDSDSASVDVGVIAGVILGTVLAITMWVWMMWRLSSKAGYRGVPRLLWSVFLAFPLTTGWTLLAFVLVPYPNQRELKRLQATQNPKNEINQELEQLRHQLRQQT